MIGGWVCLTKRFIVGINSICCQKARQKYLFVVYHPEEAYCIEIKDKNFLYENISPGCLILFDHIMLAILNNDLSLVAQLCLIFVNYRLITSCLDSTIPYCCL